MGKKILVVGYANRENIYSQNWEKSLQKSAFRYTLLGKNEKWKGWATRIKSYLRFLILSESDDRFNRTIISESEEIKHPPQIRETIIVRTTPKGGSSKSDYSFFEEVTMLEPDPNDQETIYVLIDVYDILAVGTEKEFLSKWNQYQTPIVIGAEPNCNPSLCRPLENYSNPKYAETKNKYLNFGMVAGTGSALINFLSWLIKDSQKYHPDIWNEQIATSRYIDSHPGQISLDHEMNLVGNVICHPLHGNQHQFGWRPRVIKSVNGWIQDSGPGRVEYRGNKHKNSLPVFVHTPSKSIDAFQRYQKYGCLILEDNWIAPSDDILITPGYHWIWFAFLIALVILLILFGTKEWIIAGLIITFLILILYIQSL
uniref:PLOD1-3-like GT domain-containing protein n=1 Tax=Pithovirus LCPAC202 TaxID=2506592 RepID=A0A481Z6K4_9VIRU|nr:MAG: hypothetical protein LCPAC202_01490 [Pithovirus LCPAC202]